MKKIVYLLFLSFYLQSLPQMMGQSSGDIWESLAEEAIIDQKVMMPMRDGVRLCTDIYRPKTDQPVPVIFLEPHTILTPGEMVKNVPERHSGPTKQ